MIWAILPDTSKTESLLNSLYEAEFNMDELSVMMKDMDLRNKIAKDLGPLKGIELDKLEKTLVKLGLSKEGAASCTAEVLNGKILVVMNVEDKFLPAALESFEDHSAQLIKG